MRMHRNVVRRAPLGLAAGLVVVLAAPALAQQGAGHGQAHGRAGDHAGAMPAAGLRAELIRDIEGLERKYLALADAMAGKYGWRPGDGVRSVGEVFAHVAGANMMIPTFFGVQPPERYAAADTRQLMAKLQELEKLTDEAAVKEALRHSFMHAKHAVAMVPDDQLEAMTKMFGQDATKRAAMTLLVTHMHEHLGQSIAYARTNGVVPPWSAAGT